MFLLFSKVTGIAKDVSIKAMLSSGYWLVYNNTYGHISKSSEMDEIGKRCKGSTSLCLAGGETGSDNLNLIACGNCFIILQRKLINKPILDSGVYWHFNQGNSIGFSDTSLIRQAQTNIQDCDASLSSCPNDNILSWRLDNSVAGGFRLGSIIWLNFDTNYRKYVFLKKNIVKKFTST